MSEPVWILTTAGRPTYRDVLAACRETEMTQRGIVCGDGFYVNPLVPTNWQVAWTPERKGIGYWLNLLVQDYPNADAYGWLADDTYPRTPHWDKMLTAAAGDWHVAYADDGGVIRRPYLEAGEDFSSGLVWAGDLVRAVGYIAPPGINNAWLDVSWTHLVRRFDLHRYCRDVLVEHKRNDRPFDEIDAYSVATIERDRPIYEEWLARPGGFKAAAQRIEEISGLVPVR